jgi:octaprenyl-diphosphate synthase
MPLNRIREFVQQDFNQVEQVIRQYLNSDNSLIMQLCTHIIDSGGKRLRPMLVLLAAKAFNYQGTTQQLLAAIIELIHTATLLHDDVVDTSHMRRGKKTANDIWGNEASILVGDYLYSRCFQMMVDVGSMPILALLAKTSNTIAEGEVQQLMNRNKVEVTEQDYLSIISRKTAALFSAATQASAILCDRSQLEITAMGKYGDHLGMAFQLIDDALDYGVSEQDIGKNLGDDLAEGKPTLPLIYTLQHGDVKQKQLISDAIIHGRLDQFSLIKEAIESTNAINYTYELAKHHTRLAIECLQNIPSSPAKQLLIDLAEYAVARTF